MDDSSSVRSDADEFWMRQVLDLALRASDNSEVPVGALILQGGLVVGTGANGVESQDPTAHAEMLAIRTALETVGSPHLLESTLYVTLEPCAMCAGAIVLTRIPRLVFGAVDPKAGACGSLRNVVQDKRLNHRCTVEGGVLAEECAQILKDFFARLR